GCDGRRRWIDQWRGGDVGPDKHGGRLRPARSRLRRVEAPARRAAESLPGLMPGQREIVFQGAPPILGGARLLPSPSQFFLTGEDRLRVVSANSLVGVSLKVQ